MAQRLLGFASPPRRDAAPHPGACRSFGLRRGTRYWAHRTLGGAVAATWTAVTTTSAVVLGRVTDETDWLRRGQRLWARGVLWALGAELEVEHLGAIDPSTPFVVMANHQSHADVPILFAALPFIPSFLAKKELARVPFVATALRHGGHVLVDRDGRGNSVGAIKAIANEVRRGASVVIFPEGTRGDGRKLLPFKKGAFLVAKRAGAAILPVGIHGSARLLPRGAILPTPSRVRIRIAAPLSPQAVAGMTVDQIAQAVRDRIAELAA